MSGGDVKEMIKQMQKYLDDGAPVDEQNREGMTPLHWVVKDGKEDAVAFLIEHKASVNHADKAGNTALFLAARSGRKSICERLLMAGASNKMVSQGKAWTISDYVYEKYPELSAFIESWGKVRDRSLRLWLILLRAVGWLGSDRRRSGNPHVPVCHEPP